MARATQRPDPAWFLVEQMQQLFEVRAVPETIESVDAEKHVAAIRLTKALGAGFDEGCELTGRFAISSRYVHTGVEVI